MTDHSLIAWIALCAGLALIPGPDTLLVVGNAARGGLRRGMAAAFGVMSGCLWYIPLCGFGLLAILNLSPVLFLIVKMAGALYLAWLGFQMIRGALRSAPVGSSAKSPLMNKPIWQGFLSNVLNPKVALFYAAILPQFVGTGPDAPMQGMLLIAIAYVVGGIWLTIVAISAAQASKAAKQTSLWRWLEGLLGAAFIALAGRLALERNT